MLDELKKKKILIKYIEKIIKENYSSEDFSMMTIQLERAIQWQINDIFPSVTYLMYFLLKS